MARALRPYVSAAVSFFAAALLCAAIAGPAEARETPAPLPEIAARDLPPEAREVLARIHTGGPFRHERDGMTFGNREKHLPPKSRSYYREYTVYTPGETTRGARRIICGGPKQTPEVCFYTDDHYQSFKRIRE
jgi:ribonuclease T1